MPPKKIFPKDLVKKAFQEGGEAAARKMADKLAKDGMEGATRAPGQVDRWVKEWGATSPTPSLEKPVSEPRTKTADIEKAANRGSKRRLSEKEIVRGSKRRVYDVGDPNVHGTVLTEGAQVSVVRWDVPSPWGKESNTSNEQLRDVESAPTQQVLRAKAFRVMRKDHVISTHKTATEAFDAAGDANENWVFAVTVGGKVILLMRPHWEQYRRLEAAKGARHEI